MVCWVNSIDKFPVGASDLRELNSSSFTACTVWRLRSLIILQPQNTNWALLRRSSHTWHGYQGTAAVKKKKKKWHSTAKCKACVCHLKQSAVIYLEANVCYICKIERMYSWIDVPTHKAFIYDNAKCCSGHYMKRRRAVYESSSVWPTASIYTLNITATNSLVEIFMKSSMFSCNGLAN